MAHRTRFEAAAWSYPLIHRACVVVRADVCGGQRAMHGWTSVVIYFRPPMSLRNVFTHAAGKKYSGVEFFQKSPQYLGLKLSNFEAVFLISTGVDRFYVNSAGPLKSCTCINPYRNDVVWSGLFYSTFIHTLHKQQEFVQARVF